MREHILFLLVVDIKTLFCMMLRCGANDRGEIPFSADFTERFAMIMQMLVMLGRASASVKHLTG